MKVLLNPAVKLVIDKMRLFKGSYIGISQNGAHLFIDNTPVLKIKVDYIDDLKTVLADSVKEYHDLTEYRLTDRRFNQIMIYYAR